ncbi:MAG: hypothetical protein JSR24_04270 [Proteobacteria bacterium]|nr:hypothetical protein [Pseudomonadota bacterium]
MHLGSVDLDVLHALRNGLNPDVSSGHRLRLEMMGFVRDGPRGLRLTSAGECAAALPAGATRTPEEVFDEGAQRYDALGRRLGRRLNSLRR